MKTFSFLFLFIALFGCKSPEPVRSVAPVGQSNKVESVGNAQPGTVVLRSTARGADSDKARKAAEEYAFRSIMFIGLPGTPYAFPMVEKAEESQKNNAEFYETFFKDSFRNYIMEESIESETNVQTQIEASLVIKINTNSLRQYLEQNKIIRTFGYGN